MTGKSRGRGSLQLTVEEFREEEDKNYTEFTESTEFAEKREEVKECKSKRVKECKGAKTDRLVAEFVGEYEAGIWDIVMEDLTPEGVRYRLAVIFYVHLVEHGGGGVVGVFVGGDFVGVLQGLAYVV
jgi:hypothetical protein